jgi:YidC/Oxa1 family membrane protein insertase
VAATDSAAHTPASNPSQTGSADPQASDQPVDTAAAHGQLGPFAAAAGGEARDYVIENELQKVTISSRGGTIKSVELKKYKTWDQKPLLLFTDKSQSFSYQFVIAGSKTVNTKDSLLSADRRVICGAKTLSRRPSPSVSMPEMDSTPSRSTPSMAMNTK